MNEASNAKFRGGVGVYGRENRPAAAIALVLLALALFSGMGAISKILMVRYSPLEIAWVRHLVDMLSLMPFARGVPGTPRLGKVRAT